MKFAEQSGISPADGPFFPHTENSLNYFLIQRALEII